METILSIHLDPLRYPACYSMFSIIGYCHWFRSVFRSWRTLQVGPSTAKISPLVVSYKVLLLSNYFFLYSNLSSIYLYKPTAESKQHRDGELQVRPESLLQPNNLPPPLQAATTHNLRLLNPLDLPSHFIQNISNPGNKSFKLNTRPIVDEFFSQRTPICILTIILTLNPIFTHTPRSKPPRP